MWYINPETDEYGRHGIQNYSISGFHVFPVEMVSTYSEWEGFVTLTVENGNVIAVAPNVEAYEAWKAQRPDPEPEPTAQELFDVLLGVS